MTIFRRCAWVLVLLVTVAGTRAVRAQAPADGTVAMAPVIVDAAVLFHVRGVTSFPAEVRARLIQQRVVDAAADPAVAPNSIRVVPGEGGLRIATGDRTIMGVVDADAALEGVSTLALAAAHANRLNQAVADYRMARSRPALWRAGRATLGATAVLAAAMFALAWFWRRLDGLLRRRVEARIQSVGIQSFEVMRADRIRAALESLFLGARTIGYVAVVLIYAGYILGRWPWTRGLSQGVVGLLLNPLLALGGALVANIPSLGFLAVLFVLVRVLLRLVRLFFEAVSSGAVILANFDAEWAQPTYKIVRLAIVALAVIVAYPYIPGSNSEAFKGVSLFVGIVFSLGSSSAIANIIAGYMMTYRRAFKVGDRVKIGDTVGDVIQTRLQVTHLRSLKNEEVVIPNSQILAGEVLNYSSLTRERGLLLHTEVSIGYDTAWRFVEAMLLAAAARTSGLGHEPAPFVLVKRLGDFSITYELNVPCGEVSAMARLYTALHHNILDVFNEHGVQIMVPAYEGDPPEPKVVSPLDWYVTPEAAAPLPRATARGDTRTA